MNPFQNWTADDVDRHNRQVKGQPEPVEVRTTKAVLVEGKLHEQIEKHCREKGYLYIHSRMDAPSTIQVGTPDFVICMPVARTVFLECKAKGGKTSTAQLAKLAHAKKLGFVAAVVDNFDDALTVIEGNHFREIERYNSVLALVRREYPEQMKAWDQIVDRLMACAPYDRNDNCPGCNYQTCSSRKCQQIIRDVRAILTMKELPILYKGRMVRAVIAGTKTETRRPLKPQPILVRSLDSKRAQKKGDLFIGPDLLPTSPVPNLVFALAESAGTTHCMGMKEFCETQCPYGQPGDKLWVKETFSQDFKDHYPHDPIWYRADGEREIGIHSEGGKDYPAIYSPESKVWVPFKWRPPIFMPRALSRITLEITDVRVERVQDIGKNGRKAQSVLAEGITEREIEDWNKWLHPDDAPAHAFAVLWNAVSKKEHQWAKNPWVWVIQFKMEKPPEKGFKINTTKVLQLVSGDVTV